MHRIENLIVNPAGSQGRRFLMMTVAIEVPDAKDEATLREKDAMLRDAIIGALEGQSITTITSPGGRDSVKVAIRRAVAPLVDDFDYVNIYLPQFVENQQCPGGADGDGDVAGSKSQGPSGGWATIPRGWTARGFQAIGRERAWRLSQQCCAAAHRLLQRRA